MVLTALTCPAASQTSCVGRFGQAPINRSGKSLCDGLWCMRDKGGMGRAISDETLSPANNISGTASYFCHWPNPDISEECERNLVAWRLLREQQERGCSTKENNPGAGVVAVLVGVNVLTSRNQCHSHQRSQVEWLQWWSPCPTDSPVQKCKVLSQVWGESTVQSKSDYGTTEIGTGMPVT